jgi:hypothetical protein
MKKFFIILGVVAASVVFLNCTDIQFKNTHSHIHSENKEISLNIQTTENKQQQWVNIVKKISNDPYFTYLNIEVTENNASKGGSPMEALYKDGVCYVNVDTQYSGKSLANYVSDLVQEENLSIVLETIAVHEFAHCYHMKQEAFYMTSLRQSQRRANKDGGELLKSEMLTRREETFADASALAFAKNKYPEKFSAILDFYTSLRTHKSYTHGILASIKYIRENGIQKTSDYFEVAEDITQKIDNKGLF